ncbi:MAG: hypothetical protein GF349_01475 [Candidatus Magasanikbacteria bacterium]|nr:hypothetical protein [Candidatus Magasanikbacteria bacterium]
MERRSIQQEVVMKSSLHALLKFFLAPVTAAICIFGCTDESDPLNSTASSQEVRVQLELVEGVTAKQALTLFSMDSVNPVVGVSVNWGDHSSHWLLESGSPDEQLEQLLEAEEDQLNFLITNFDPEDELEAPVYAELNRDLNDLREFQDLPVSSIMIEEGFFNQELKKHDLVMSVSFHEEKPVAIQAIAGHDNGQYVVGQQAITDYRYSDRNYMPVGGTSTIWTTGSLQKFWFDDSSLRYLNGHQDGIEIDTLIYPRYSARCGSSGWGSNLPWKYKDSEAFDWYTGSARNCSVGSISANQLRPWRLYWTWHPFSYFNTRYTPFVKIQFQPSKWCDWIDSTEECIQGNVYGMLRGLAWCMCSRDDLPIRNLLSYYYFEAPGREVRWQRN